MLLKPKSTVGNDMALLYKRFIGLENSNNLRVVYKTHSDNLYWLFNADLQIFNIIDAENLLPTTIVKTIYDNITILQFQSIYFKYNGSDWVKTTNITGEGITLLSATFNNIAKYQMNKYYFAGSFDYVIKGSIEGTTTQYIKGNIMPLTALNIKHYNDSIQLAEDDLVVIDKHLYSVENPSTTQKRLPRAFRIYFATLNSIL